MRSGFQAPFNRLTRIKSSVHRNAGRRPGSHAGRTRAEASSPGIVSAEAGRGPVRDRSEVPAPEAWAARELALPVGTRLAALLAATTYLVAAMLVVWTMLAPAIGR